MRGVVWWFIYSELVLSYISGSRSQSSTTTTISPPLSEAIIAYFHHQQYSKMVSLSSSPLQIKVAVVGTGILSSTATRSSSVQTTLKALEGILRLTDNNKQFQNVFSVDETSPTTSAAAVHRVYKYRYISDKAPALVQDEDEDNESSEMTTSILLGQTDTNSFFESLRDDTVVTFVVVPGIGGGSTSSSQHTYLSDNWETFDCALVVANPFNDDDHQHQRSIQYIQRLLVKTKKIPTMMLCHYDNTPTTAKSTESSDLGLEEGRRRIARLEEMVRMCNDSHTSTMKSHSTVIVPTTDPSMTIGMMSYESDDDDDDDDDTASHGDGCGVFEDNGSSGSMSVDSSEGNGDDFDYTSYKLGSKTTNELLSLSLCLLNKQAREQLMTFYVASARTMEGVQPYPIQVELRRLIGTADAQTKILLGKKESALKKLKAESFFPFVDTLRTICEKYQQVDSGTTFKEDVTTNFWLIYSDCEDGSFSRFEREMNPERLNFAVQQLQDYKTWIDNLHWKDEEEKVLSALNSLVRRQLNFILHKNSLWSFDDWYRKMNACGWTMKNLPHNQQNWSHISPNDWGTIIGSLLLASSDRYFYESFGREKIALERARYVSTDRCPSSHPDIDFMAKDGCPSLHHALDGTYENGRFRPEYRQTFDCVVRFDDVPENMSDPRHWGHIAYKHSSIVRSNRRGKM